jgi:myo-inositol 2-dehydrogenase/D-chiro-inositol 1-dehydrogenase
VGSSAVWREFSDGLPQEVQHFVDSVLEGKPALETGEDGREVLRIIYAAYESAATGRRIDWPYDPPKDKTPFEMWQGE